MRKTKEEKNLLARLVSGALDGPVGNLFECGGHKKVYYGKYIKDGVPVSYREGESTRFFNGKENERIPGKRSEEVYETDDEKLYFMQKFGWLINDDDANKYSAKYKGKV